jgi:hypothetical protein
MIRKSSARLTEATMKVSELAKQLARMPQDVEVYMQIIEPYDDDPATLQDPVSEVKLKRERARTYCPASTIVILK